MKRRIIALFVVIGLFAAAMPAAAAGLPGEGYAWPTFREIVQTFVLMKGLDITKPKVADEYGRITYCELYRRNYSNDFLWKKIRDEIVSRALKKKEYFRVRYQAVATFKLGRYDFKTHYFPFSHLQAFENVGYINLYTPSGGTSFCDSGPDPIFSAYGMMKLDTPLTIEGFSISEKKVQKLMVRMQEAGNKDRKIYARIRVVVTGAEKGIGMSAGNSVQFVLDGYVTSVDFFLDPKLTEPIGHMPLAVNGGI
ncbi:MAG: DUF4852 domain-containing protein [Alphaproteobacteria bacterium]|nr:DUF4852 domain-containing protein [Alphaproteobacteria bacterium]